MAGNKRISIYRDPTNSFDLVEIKLIGDPNTVIYKMKDKEQQIKQEFPNDYNAYYKNKNIVKNTKNHEVLDRGFDAAKYEQFDDEYPPGSGGLEHDPKMRATYDAILEDK